ncbi:CO/xanthine dehydrogenase Mo-binding subunit [Streptomyces sp. SPB162]|nr:CO/xanthine dehydrogenase Mo-binding subunit [Streptomyces sp. SPB162]
MGVTRNPTNITQGSKTKGGLGESTLRPDGTLKVTGEFAYSSDMWHEDMLWGFTLRSPHAHAKILSIDTGEALKTPGVYAVMTHDDLPAFTKYGLEYKDTPVLADGVVRCHGEPVALVAADHPETARRAAAKIKVEYEPLPLVIDEETALADGAPILHPNRDDHHAGHVTHPNIVHRQPIIRGDVNEAAKRADIVISGEYEVGMQDQAFLGPESGLAVPAEDGGVDLYIATQWLHSDLGQLAPVLGLPEDKIRMTLSGVGGAFGGREDLSMQAHACLLALRTGKPVKIVYNRFESFFGHVHRHPAKLWYEHGVTREGKITHMRCRIVLDGGAYASASPAVVGNASSLSVGPYVIDDVEIEAVALYTNNPPCGAMRGFGAVQACFAYEAQMDKLAAALDMDPVEFRRLNAMSQGTIMPTGQPVDSPAPVAELLRRVKALPMPPEQQWLAGDAEGLSTDVRDLPGGLSNTTHGEGVVRGVGYAVGIKNVGFSEGFDDYSTARVRLEVINGEPVAMVHTAMAEVGQGGVTVHAQIARTELGVAQVTIRPADTQVGSAGSTSASRQTYVTGGAVKNSCEAVREKVLELGPRPVRQLPPRVGHRRTPPGGRQGRHRRRRGARRPGGRHRGRGHRHRAGVAAPPDPGVRPGHRAGPRPRPVLLLRPPRGRRGRHRAGSGQGHRAGRGPGRRQGAQPAVGRRPDPGRHHPGPRPGRHGGDHRRQEREGAEPVLHRLPDPHHPRHADHPGRRTGTRRRARSLRAARHR